jgi:hypothetical protein
MPKSALPRSYETSKLPAFDVQAFLDSTGVARKVVDFRKKATIFAQGDTAKHVLYIPRGGVKLSLGARLRHRVTLDTEMRLEEPFVSLSSFSQKGSHEEANGNDRSLHAIYVCLYPTRKEIRILLCKVGKNRR